MDQHTRILIAADDPGLRHTIAGLLVDLACPVLETDSGRVALRLARERHPGLALVTPTLSDLNGLEICRRLKADPTLSDTLVVLLSDAEALAGETVEQSGADGYLHCPQTADRHPEFLTQVKTFIRLAVAIERTRLFEQAQRMLEARLHAVVATLPVALFAVDYHGILTMMDGKGLDLPGITDTACTGQSALQVFHEVPELSEIVRRGLDGESVNLTVDNGSLSFDVWGSPVRDQSGMIVGMIGIATEVTQPCEPASQMDHQERLAAVGQLAGGIAHDFRNFLTTIVLYANLLRKDQRLPEDLKPAADTIITESHRASDLVQQILDFSRRAPLQTQAVDMVGFLEDLSAILRRTLPTRIQLTTEIKPDVALVDIDATRIQQLVMNLATNARDAMPNGGRLQIGLQTLRVRAEGPLPLASMSAGEWVCLSIADTGTGMSEEVLAHLYEPFFTTKGEAGTGLGLSQVYGIVRQHEGHIDVQSEVGRGTTFRIYLPASRSQQASIPMSRMTYHSESSSHEGSVAAAGEEETIRKAAYQALISLGYRMQAAAHPTLSRLAIHTMPR